MTCLGDAQIMQYLDGELGEEASRRFVKHLHHCSDCLGQLEEYQKIYQMFEVFDCEPEMDFTSQVMNRLPEVDFKRKRVLKPFLFTAAILIVLYLSWSVYVPFPQVLSSVWDGSKIVLSILTDVSSTLLVIFKAMLIVYYKLSIGVEWVSRVLNRPVLIWGLTSLVAFWQVIFLKFYVIRSNN